MSCRNYWFLCIIPSVPSDVNSCPTIEGETFIVTVLTCHLVLPFLSNDYRNTLHCGYPSFIQIVNLRWFEILSCCNAFLIVLLLVYWNSFLVRDSYIQVPVLKGYSYVLRMMWTNQVMQIFFLLYTISLCIFISQRLVALSVRLWSIVERLIKYSAKQFPWIVEKLGFFWNLLF